MVDDVVTAAPQQPDPEMSSTRKGTEWYFGMKLHVGTDPRGLAHTAVVTTAKVHDSQVMAELLHGQAILAEGGTLSDPAAFSRRLAELLVEATAER